MTRGLGMRVTVLCEDRAHDGFVRGLLPGAQPHEINALAYPRGFGSGKAFVDSRIAAEFKALSRRSSHQRVCLLVVTDADNETTRERREQLLKRIGLARPPEEHVLFLIPKWEIETWFLVLRDERVGTLANAPWTESESYKRKADGISPKEAAAVFLEFAQSHRDENVLRERFPSLTEGIDAFRGW
jgi:hypothetical protein